MKWYWIVLIAIAIIVIGFFVTRMFLKNKTDNSDIRNSILPTQNTTTNNTPVNCNPNQQLAAPPIGKSWVCQNGTWVLVATNTGIA